MSFILRRRVLAIGLALIAGAGSGHAARTPGPSHRVYRDRVEPHWFSGASGEADQFWYAVSLPENGREFILVNALTGRRAPAFDQRRVAAALSGTLGRPVDAERLPVETIEFSKDGKTVTLSGLDASWKLDLQSYVLVPLPAGDFAGNRLPAGRRPHPSLQTGGATQIKFMNRLQQPVDIFWIDPGGKRVAYGSLSPGENRENATYAGHVWLVASRGGDVLGVFEAQASAGLAILDGQGFVTERRRDGGSRQRRPDAVSPDGNWQAVVHGDNLFLRDTGTGKEAELTDNGKSDDTYAGDGEAPRVYWSPDSKHLVAMRTRPGAQRRVYEVDSSPQDQLQPKLQSYAYLKAGDQVPVSKPHLFDVGSRKEIPVSDTLFSNPWSIEDLRWNSDSSRFTFLYNQRGHQALRILAVDAQTGAASAIVNEESKTFIDYSGKYFSQYLDDTGEIIWMSERDGWNHLYLYDAKTGAVKNQITKGEWVVRSVDFVDPAKRQIWFQAGGIVPGQDPYYIQYCRVNFDGGGLTVLTEGDGTHTAQFSPDRRFLIDTWSRVDSPPVLELRRAGDGGEVCKLEAADAGELYATGWRPPEPFVAKGRDGATDIYGVIWRPRDFDPNKKYPVIESNYAGPQDSNLTPTPVLMRLQRMSRHT
jgi:dipeptidyl-peptidase-4